METIVYPPNQNLSVVGHSFQKIFDIPWSKNAAPCDGPETLTE